MKIYYIIFLWTISCTINVYGQLAELVKKNEKAVFQIFTYDEYGAPFATGTGFFIKPDGTALTNLHIFEDAKYAFIRDVQGGIYQVDGITKISKECDLAELKIIPKNAIFTTLTLNTNIPLKGSDIFVIGNPEGFENTVTKGIISAIRTEKNLRLIQISAPISPGSSGSPIMDMNGNVFAIATYQSRQGQNLNFGYWIGCQEQLIINTEIKLAKEETGNLYILNKVCDTERNLILNSIEVNEKNTVLNCTFTNTSLAFGDYAFIFTVIGDQKQAFYIEDEITRKKYYAYDATIGNSAKDPTFLKLGEAKRFKIYFPPVGGIKELSIKEGMQGGDWSFPNIKLNDYKGFVFNDDDFASNFYFQTGLQHLSEKDYVEAYIILKDYATTDENNDYAHNLAGIISFILGNYLDAFIYIKQAIEINPTNDNYYFNLYYLNELSDNIDEAIRNISSAIQLNNNQPEYYECRGGLYMKKKYWKEAIADFDKFINSDRQVSSYTYLRRGIAKVWIRDNTSCKDFEEAYSSAEDDEIKKIIVEWYNKNCTSKKMK